MESYTKLNFHSFKDHFCFLCMYFSKSIATTSDYESKAINVFVDACVTNYNRNYMDSHFIQRTVLGGIPVFLVSNSINVMPVLMPEAFRDTEYCLQNVY